MSEIETFSQQDKIFDGHYQLLRPLSTEGGTADVWLAIDTNTIDSMGDTENNPDNASGMLVAIKVYRPKNALDIDGEQRFRDEFKIVYECRHENLLQPTNFSIFDGIPYLVLPYCKYGSSEQLIGKTLSADDIWKFILDVSSGLNRLHTNNPTIIHQDIKPANILIDNSKDYAITDFGISSRSGGDHGYYYDEENSGTMAYMAPERFQENTEPMPQSDIWAFGATLYEILTGKVPFGEEGGKFQTGSPIQITPVSHIPSDIQHLISDCLSLEPGNRPSAKDIKESATARQYPLRSKNRYLRTFGLIGIGIAITVICIIFLFSPSKPKETCEIPIEQLYQIAVTDISSDNTATVKHGITLMDSLSNLRYIPAIYQMAYTYGWYIEDESLKRKSILGIEVFDEEKKGLPKTDRYSNEALALFSKILELNDSKYPDINAKAAYRLACYYVNPNPIIKPNMAKGRMYLEQSRKWAELYNDSVLLKNINQSLQTFK
ncbi:serine/threonine-protein kinase [Xylanibacter muris]|uniref:Serine/threonine protein kinase n=1 Tax=Xylanibacter muris TaxID=2736290 RepID=A0ABX2AKS8_9BACT|nr:serine/threonine-protein kinase [Xylanibacter muris]NPD91715.1 serine/threonine protein kinase [Xylanibacter muris]